MKHLLILLIISVAAILLSLPKQDYHFKPTHEEIMAGIQRPEGYEIADVLPTAPHKETKA